MADENTTHQGVLPEQEAEQARRAAQGTDQGGEDAGNETPPYSDSVHPGRSIVSKIAANRRKAMEAETGEDFSSGDDAGAPSGADNQGAGEPATQDSGAGQDAGEAGKPQQQAGADAGVDPETPVTVKIYGEEHQIPLWQLQRDYQVNAAGHRKLQEANQRLSRAQQMEAQLQQRQQATGQGQQPAGAEDQPIGQPSGQERQQAATDQDKALELANKLQFGDTNEVAEAIREMQQQQGRTQGDGATPDANTIAQQATQQVRDQMAQEQALNAFRQEYPEIFQDEYLSGLAGDAANDMMRRALIHIGYPQDRVGQADAGSVQQAWRQEQRRGTLPSDLDLYRAAGDEVRTRLQKWGASAGGQQQNTGANGAQQQPPKQQQAASSRDQKRAAKRQQTTPPGAGQNQSASLQEQGPNVRSGQGGQDTVDWLKKKRGQVAPCPGPAEDPE